MHFICAVLISFSLLFLFWFTGHVITKKIKGVEDNKLLASLTSICIGTSVFLIIVNLIGRITSSFNLGLVFAFGFILLIIIWQLKELSRFFVNLKLEITKFSSLSEFIVQKIDKYLLGLLAIVNLIYGLTAFSITKLERFEAASNHVLYINYFLSDSFLNAKTHLGASILGAVISKFSKLHPELSLDILVLIFLNLSFLTFYALAEKFLGQNKINKYIVPVVAFFAWGPITSLFANQSKELLPSDFLAKVLYLTETKLIDAANLSGLVLNWFFSPPCGIGIFFFLVSLYMVFNLSKGNQNRSYLILASIVSSSLVIVDFTKFVVLVLGIILYMLLLFLINSILEGTTQEISGLSKNTGVFFLSVLVMAVIHAWGLKELSTYMPFQQLQGGSVLLHNKSGAFQSNAILLLLYAFGFYESYKLKHRWVWFLTPFFLVALIFPYIAPLKDTDSGKITMLANLLGAFALPLTLNYLLNYFKVFDVTKQKVFYAVLLIAVSANTLMFWAFGDKPKPLFKLEGKVLKYTGLQQIPATTNFNESEFAFIKYLNSAKSFGQSILVLPQHGELYSTLAGLNVVSPESDIQKWHTLYSLNGDSLKENRLSWLYLTPQVFRFMLPAEAKRRFINAYLKKDIEFCLNNKKTGNRSELAELYKVNVNRPMLHFNDIDVSLVTNFLNPAKTKTRAKAPFYIKEIALSPYFGIYSAMSKDFNGDGISDIAFFDSVGKKWHIIYGKSFQEKTVDLTQNLLANVNNSDLFIPIPSDYDADKKTDIALFNFKDSSWIVLRSSDNKADFSRGWSSKPAEIPMPMDLDGDLKTDVSCYASNDGTWHSFLTSKNQYYSENFGFSILDIPTYADIDGDGKGDFVLYRSTLNQFDVYLSSQSYDKRTPVKVTIGEKNSRVVLGDYDGDKKTDLATWTPNKGKWEIVFARDFLPLGRNVISPNTCGVSMPDKADKKNCSVHIVKLGRAGDIPMPGDYDGDGKEDVSVIHLDDFELEIIYSSGAKKKLDLSKYKKYIPASFIGV